MTLRFGTGTVVLLLAGFVEPVGLGADLNNWRTIPAPTITTTPINAIGTTVTYLTPTDAHLYSGITKEWTVLPLSAAPTFYEQYNSYVVIRDGNEIHGFATRQGVVDTITVSPAAVIVSGPISSSWVTLVSDGTMAWGFSGFRGEWVPLALSQPNPTMSARRYCGLLQDGNTVYGFSAYWATFVPIVADAQAVILTEEEVGTAHSPSVFRAFSVHQNNWGTQAFNTQTLWALTAGFAIAASGNTVVAFSGLTGNLATYTASSPVATIFNDEMVAAVIDGPNVACYSAGQGAFASMAASSPSIVTEYEYLFVVEPTQVTPFSALTGAFGATLAGSYALLTNEVIAYADAGTSGFAYSPILNTWTAAPAVAPIAAPVLVRSAIVLPHSTGFSCLSARYGTWVDQPTTQLGVFLAPPNTATILIFDAGDVLHVFDSRLNRFATEAGQGPLSAQVNRHTALAHDASFAYGFGQPTGRWDVVPINGPVVTFDIASSIGFVETASELHVYCVQGSFSYEARFPEFSRATKLGTTMHLYQTAPAGSGIVMMAGLFPTYVDLGSQGILNIDPSVLFVQALPVLVPASGRLEIPVPLPIDPALVGLQPHLQNIIFPPNDAPYLSTSVSPILY